MEWKRVLALKSEDLISEFEQLTKYTLCESFKNCVRANNGGRPSKKGFDTDKYKGRAVKLFLSFNKEDRETVWKILDWAKEMLQSRYIPFADDNFGNFICFDSKNGNVVFINHEDDSVEFVAENFDGFMDCLYEI